MRQLLEFTINFTLNRFLKNYIIFFILFVMPKIFEFKPKLETLNMVLLTFKGNLAYLPGPLWDIALKISLHLQGRPPDYCR